MLHVQPYTNNRKAGYKYEMVGKDFLINPVWGEGPLKRTPFLEGLPIPTHT